MALPVLLLNSRVLAFAGGILIGAVSKSQFGKDLVSTMKEGVTGLMDDLERDYSKNRQLVKDIKSGKVK